MDLDLLCGVSNEQCNIEPTAEGIKRLTLNEKGQVQFDEKTAGMSLSQFLETSKESKQMSGPTGGVQGWTGTLFGIPYAPGSWPDKLIEAFSGTHDMVGGKLSGLYDEQGNIKRGMTQVERSAYDKWAAAAIVPAAPFAAAEGLSPEIWKAISILLRAAR